MFSAPMEHSPISLGYFSPPVERLHIALGNLAQHQDPTRFEYSHIAGMVEFHLCHHWFSPNHNIGHSHSMSRNNHWSPPGCHLYSLYQRNHQHENMNHS